MGRRLLLVLAVFLLLGGPAGAEWLPLEDVATVVEETELGGPRLTISYHLPGEDVSEEKPVYVFVRYRTSPEGPWRLLPRSFTRGSGHGLVTSAGEQKIAWWGIPESTTDQPEAIEVKVRALPMVRVPAGEFVMKAVPGGGYATSGQLEPVGSLPLFYIAHHEATVSMYADFLNETGTDGVGWFKGMANPERVGIERVGEAPPYRYEVVEGRERYPMALVSWYNAVAFLDWCGLRLPTEAEWEKAYRGGRFLDGDEVGQRPNPAPEREFPWGDEPPSAQTPRCNYEGDEDGFPNAAPIGSFPGFESPYGAVDMAGNVAEWTLDWYSTSYHADLDGFRMRRGGSWRSVPEGVGAVSGATSLPMDGSSLIGFRGVLPGFHE
jgi:formylglycine-generating enzyme required for sulfatase activity